eukprot:TRINITY_DN20712_c0_g1::TRINITY_DN20712_c0_g1_i1::g.9060::m.9060 TRINITY_DN20712_c0_g1::TRINITY_DN20712_c0_g1_i1::g.9060  ORF type:complete len:185 (+),score=43.79,sp/F4I9J7/Y14_ARATH/49.73/5e-44,RRM_1/PF00076.17/2.3e-18,RRM_6/PF14259.1/5.6e-14,RRM_5/PF13893.1/1.9e-11,Ribosomal_L3/PF00297.17/0.38,Ribosomal_L3/PF00297.17/1e+03 TRINITY_DN20712_c0_g1_i1:33-557(+)
MSDVADAVDFEPEEMEVEASADTGAMRSGKTDAAGRKTKGRGFKGQESDDRYEGQGGVFDRLGTANDGLGPQRSVEGWIIFVNNLHEEATEEDLMDKFQEFGEIKNLHLNLDRRTGFVKGYALIEYDKLDEASTAIESTNGSVFMDRTINVTWAFSKGPLSRRETTRRKPASRS